MARAPSGSSAPSAALFPFRDTLPSSLPEHRLAVRFTFLEAVYTILVVAGGLTALVANRLGWDVLKNAGLIVVFLGVIVFGLDMVVQRRAEIGTRYSSSVNPSFHVFRGFGAVAWGIVFVLAGSLFAGYAYLGQHTSVLVIMGGTLVTAWGLGSATGATYRYRGTEKPARRFADRVAAIFLIVPFGLAILGWGLLRTFAPSVADAYAAALKSAAVRWIEFLLN
jgi:hypothetical protein